MRTIRWGIIGCGDVTEVKSGPALQLADNSSLVAVMRRNGKLAQDYALRHGVPRWYDSAQDLIDDPEVDAVYIATPPAAHHEYTLRCAQAGKPVYVEKPMARNFAECQAMIEACRTAGVPLLVAYYRRALGRFRKIKELIDTGAIGEVRFVNVTLYQRVIPATAADQALPWRVIPEISGGGLFVDLASHMLDFLDYALGPIRSVRGFAANQAARYPAEDIVTGSFVFESGVQGVGSWCFSAFDRCDRTEIVGSAGMISYATFEAQPVVLTTSAGREEFAIADPPHIQQPLIQTVVDELNGVGACPSSGDSAARTSWVMDQLLQGFARSS
ncbi:MAG TPA: Gfo/Idh/MocA family oxidoreductase [Roseiflexaceae bacterium]|nr:Gfo/Idh/MocA family oxidoreductase [Roseiflexaceae bacterium]